MASKYSKLVLILISITLVLLICLHIYDIHDRNNKLEELLNQNIIYINELKRQHQSVIDKYEEFLQNHGFSKKSSNSTFDTIEKLYGYVEDGIGVYDIITEIPSITSPFTAIRLIRKAFKYGSKYFR